MPNTDEAVRFLRKCMRGLIKPEDVFLPELTIPDDIGDSIELSDDPERSAIAGKPVKRVMLGQFYLGTYSEGSDAGGTSAAPEALHHNIRVLMQEFYMLKPFGLSLQKNDAGKYDRLSCRITYDRDCCEKKFTVETIEELTDLLYAEREVVLQRYGGAKDQAMHHVINWLKKEDRHRLLMVGLGMKQDESIMALVNAGFTREIEDRIQGRRFCKSVTHRWTSIWRLGGFRWMTEQEPERLEQHDKAQLFDDAADEFRRYLYFILFEFCYLDPGPLSIEVNEDNTIAVLSCTIRYGADGYPQTIRAESFAEFVWALQSAAYALSHNEPMTRFVEAKLFVRCCLRGFIPYGSVPEPEIIMHERFSEWTKIPEEYVESQEIILRNCIRENMKRYYMLKPGSVTFEKCPEDDNYLDFCCTIEYDRNGEKKKIRAQTLSELTLRMEIERDLLMKGEDVLMTYKEYIAGTDLKYYFENDDDFDLPIHSPVLNARKKDRLWRLLGMLISGTSEDQTYARRQITEICANLQHSFGYAVEEASRKDQLIRTEKTDLESVAKQEYFFAILEDSMGKNKRFKNASQLADIIGYSEAQFSRVRHGKNPPSKEFALRFGIALQLSRIEMEKLLAAAGHAFPVDRRDVLVIEAIEKGCKTYHDVVDEICKTDISIQL